MDILNRLVFTGVEKDFEEGFDMYRESWPFAYFVSKLYFLFLS